MSAVAVRRGQVGDLDRLLPLFLGYLRFYEVEEDPGHARRYLAAHLEAGTATVLVAERSESSPRDADTTDGLDGFALLYPTWDSLQMSRRWILHDLYVAPDARRGGVGRALIDASLELARSTSATSVSLDTAHDNRPAQALYEHAGFVRDRGFVTYHHDLG